MGNIIEVNSDNWSSEVIGSTVLTLVDFWHDSCPWCLRLNPIIEEAAEEYKNKLKFVKFNVLKTPENRETAINNGVMATPTLAFYCNGRLLRTMVGIASGEQLKAVVNEMIETHKECLKHSTELNLANP